MPVGDPSFSSPGVEENSVTTPSVVRALPRLAGVASSSSALRLREFRTLFGVEDEDWESLGPLGQS